MKQLMKKIVLPIVIMALLTAPVWGRGPGKVENTIHNLSTTQPEDFQYESDNVEEICVFCHTPHGGLLTGPLWNHSMPSASSFTHYNSVTLSGYMQNLSATRDVNDESLLCMACHDGSVAVDHLVNNPNSIGTDPVTFFGGNTEVFIPEVNDKPAARIGASLNNLAGSGDLTDDHPISFSYDSVLADPAYSGGSKDGELHDVATALSEDVRFFRSTNNVECSSCHDPHVDYWTYPEYAPFLVRSNDGSGLCLACHNK